MNIAIGELNPELLTVGLDTSVLFKNNPRALSPKLKLLCDLAARGRLQLAACDVVLREWEGQLVDEISASARELHAAARKLRRAPMVPGHQINLIMSASLAEGSWISDFEAAARRGVRSAIDNLPIHRIAVSDDAFRTALDAFFDGLAPFAKKRSRDDLPDALIHFCMRELSRDFRSLHFVSNDMALATAMQIAEVRVSRDLDELLAHEAIRSLHRDQDFALRWERDFRSVRRVLEAQERYLPGLLKPHLDRELRFVGLVLPEFPENSEEASVASVVDLVEFRPTWSEASSLGDGLVQVPALLRVRAEIQVAVDRADVYSMPDWIRVQAADLEQYRLVPGYGVRDLMLYASFGLLFDPLDNLELLDVNAANISLDAIEVFEILAPPGP